MISELSEGLLRRCLVAHYPEDAKYRNEGEDVEDDHDAFERWELPQEDSICAASI